MVRSAAATLAVIKSRSASPPRDCIACRSKIEPAEVEGALQNAVPAVLAGVIGATSRECGRDILVRLLSNSFAGGVDNATARLEADPAGIAMKGNDALAWLLGRDRQEALVSRFACHVGRSREAASLLVGIVAALTLAALGERASGMHDGAERLLRELQDEKGDMVDAIPASFAKALRGFLGFGGEKIFEAEHKTLADLKAALDGRAV
jgi:hypothetical protein